MIDELAINSNDLPNGLNYLPKELQAQINKLIVNRQGSIDKAYMRTESFLGYVQPGNTYQLCLDGLIKASNTSEIKTKIEPIRPASLALTGNWQSEISLKIDNANILGGNGSYLLLEGEQTLNIPIAPATPEHLAYYDSTLVRIDDYFSFNGTANMPVTITIIGDDYVDGYLLNPNFGGGAYLEMHDQPHFHMPLDQAAKGYLIIGKKNSKDRDEISAFKIPYGYGVYMGPWAIHSDAHLVGRYMVVYSVTDNYSTVIIRRKNGQIANVSFGEYVF